VRGREGEGRGKEDGGGGGEAAFGRGGIRRRVMGMWCRGPWGGPKTRARQV